MELLEPRYHLIQAYTWACADAGHAVCGNPSACEKFAGSASRQADAENRASSFDARRAALSRRAQMPDHSWSTTELLVRVEELLRAQPDVDGPFRTIAIATGLARRGERSLPVDWLLRDRIGPGLIRRAILASASVWHRVAVGDLDARDVPDLSGWLAAIAEDAPSPYDPEKDLGRVFVNSLSGRASAAGHAWIGEASISDIAAWRVEGYLASPPAPGDMALPGGRAASRWVHDRLTRTSSRSGPRSPGPGRLHIVNIPRGSRSVPESPRRSSPNAPPRPARSCAHRADSSSRTSGRSSPESDRRSSSRSWHTTWSTDSMRKLVLCPKPPSADGPTVH